METKVQTLIQMSDEAHKEFKKFLESNNVEQNTIRITLAGYACSGPRFGLMVDDFKDGDASFTIQDLTFYVESTLVEEFGGFQILSTEENYGQGMVLRPLNVPESAGCGTCAGC